MALPSKNAHKDDLKMARNRIAKALMGPKRKVCDCDVEIAERLEAIDLDPREYKPFA